MNRRNFLESVGAFFGLAPLLGCHRERLGQVSKPLSPVKRNRLVSEAVVAGAETTTREIFNRPVVITERHRSDPERLASEERYWQWVRSQGQYYDPWADGPIGRLFHEW